MIIKAIRLQSWAPQGEGGGGGGSRVGRRPPPPSKKEVFWLYWGPFCYFFFIYGGLFAIFFHFWVPFYFMVGAFFGLAPPTKIFAGAHDCKEGSRACSPKIFLCNLVSSGHVLLRFCLKNDKK